MILPASALPVIGSAMWFDLFPAPEIACSLRQLNRNATNCLLVTSVAGGASTIIGFSNGLVDIAAINSFIAAYGGCYVERWYNQNLSSSINSMAQGTVSPNAKPEINPSLYTENGFPCLYFDGSNDRLQMFTGTVYTSLTLPSSYTILMTSRNRNSTANAGFGMMFSDVGSSSNAGFLCTYQGFCYLGDTTQGTSQIQSTDDRKTFASFLGSRTSSTTRKITINGVDETTSSTAYTNAGTVSYLGRYGLTGTVYSSAKTTELIYYDTDVQSFHSAMQANQQAAWGIA